MEDQAGFLPNRHIKDNIRIVVDLLEYGEMSPGKKFGFFFLDAEKAFDRVNWQFMKRILKEINMGERLQKAIQYLFGTNSGINS